MAARGGSRGSNRAERPHRRVVEALAGSPWPGRGWSCRDDPKGIADELELRDGSPRPAQPGCGFYKFVEGVGVVAGAPRGWGWQHL